MHYKVYLLIYPAEDFLRPIYVQIIIASIIIWHINIGPVVSPHFMRGRELSTLVVILSVIMGIHFKVIKLEHRVLYSH